MKHTNRIKNSDVKSIVACSISKGAASLVVFAAMLVGCGQKGALYLPSGSGSHTASGTQNTHTQSNSQNNTQHTGAKQHAQQTTEDNADF